MSIPVGNPSPLGFLNFLQEEVIFFVHQKEFTVEPAQFSVRLLEL